MGYIIQNNHHLGNIICSPVLGIFQKITRIQSFGWHWKEYSQAPDFPIHVKGDMNIKNRNPIFRQYYRCRYTWQKVVILKPVSGSLVPWRMGCETSVQGQLERKLCNLNLLGEVGTVVGPSDVNFFGIRLDDGGFLQLEIMKITTKDCLSEESLII